MADLIVGKNSFISLDESNDIMSSNFLSSSDERVWWDGLTDDDKAVVVLKAVNMLNNDKWFWLGQKIDTEQTLVFPRKLKNGDIIDIDFDFKIGLIKLIINQNQSQFNKYDELISKGVASFSDGGGMSLKFCDSVVNKKVNETSSDMIPDDIFKSYFIKYTHLSF